MVTLSSSFIILHSSFKLMAECFSLLLQLDESMNRP